MEALCDKVYVMSDWKSLRSFPLEKYKHLGTNKTWQNLFIDCYEDFPNFFKLLSIILVLPVSTVYCERGFSYHNITKNKIRNRLKEKKSNPLISMQLFAYGIMRRRGESN